MPALDGLRILDMTQYEAGTSCTQCLAWLGADVVKIESVNGGDPGRGLAYLGWEDSEYFINWNSNKRSVAVDLASAEGRQILLDMLPNYDVFVENFGPGVIEKLDLGYETMKAVHPEIIYARIKGFGASGPYAGYKSFDMVAQAAAGAFSITGEPDGPPMRPGPTIADSGSGVQMALAITAAYVQKLRTRKGQLIEISMQEAMTYFMRTMIALGSKWGTQVAERRGNGTDPAINMYPCRPFGPNDYVYIACVTDRMWKALCRAINREDLLEDERFKDAAGRKEHWEVLEAEIAEWTRRHTKDEAMRILAEAGIPASKIFDTRDLFNDPHLNERDFIKKIHHEKLGEVPVLGWGVRMSENDVPLQAAPLLGRHTESVLAEDLGLTEAQLADLKARNIIAHDPALEFPQSQSAGP